MKENKNRGRGLHLGVADQKLISRMSNSSQKQVSVLHHPFSTPLINTCNKKWHSENKTKPNREL